MIEILIPVVVGAVGTVIGWIAKSFADGTTVYDIAGNVAAKACIECHQLVESDKDLTRFNRCWSCYSREVNSFLVRTASAPDPHVDLVVDTISPLGFVAAQLRLSGDYAKDRSIIDDAGRALDAAVEGLKADLTPCVDCSQINGNHRATCAGWGESLSMNWVAKEPKEAEDAKG